MSAKSLTAVILAIAAGSGAGYWLAGQQHAQAPISPAAEQPKGKILFYRNPMNPAITSSVPAKDEMGMDYIPVYAGGSSASSAPSGTVRIDPVVTQNIGVRTAKAERKTLTRDIRTVGRIDYDERLVARLHPKVEGWVEKLFIEATGAPVKQNDILLALYSPQLVASEEEYLLALKHAETLKNSPFADIREGAANLARSARQRLELLDVPAHQLHELKKTGKVIKNLHIHSPFDGIVVRIGAREGQRVTPETELYTIADLSRVWVYVDVYEDEMPWVKQGDAAEISVNGIPGRVFRGSVSYIYPYLDGKTRTNKVRLEFDNGELLLKPEMFANVTLRTSKQINAVVVPSEAVVRSGSSDRVFVVNGDGRFEPRAVRLGITTDNRSQIIAGLEAGETVVTSAQFLIDSESKLNEAAAKMSVAGETGMPMPPATAESKMPTMPMPEMEPAPMQMEHHHGHH